jgi:AcrR family transcriptional regulator
MRRTGKTMMHAIGRRPKSAGCEMDTRKDILAAARRVFALKGFDGTSVREVAETARVNKAMIYYHFKDKLDLYRAVLSDSFETLQDIWRNEVFQQKTTARIKIQTYIEGFIRFQLANEDLRRIMAMEFSTAGNRGNNIKWIAKHYFSKNHLALVEILKTGMASGELKKMDPLMAVVSLLGMITHLFIYQPLSPYIRKKNGTLSASKLGPFVTEIFFSGLGARRPHRI